MVVLRSAGIAGFFGVAPSILATEHYVDVNCTNPIPPFTDWGTAATNIQDAVGISNVGDSVLVTNGVYEYGGLGGARVYMNWGRPLTIRSVNGPLVTTILGVTRTSAYNMHCVKLADGAVISGFTMTNGCGLGTGYNGGGGVYCDGPNAIITNCIIAGNTGDVGGGVYKDQVLNCLVSSNTGGGLYGCRVDNCVIIGNTNATSLGAGANGCQIVNSLVASNTAFSAGGGVYMSFVTNCVILGNRAGYEGGGADGGTLVGCLIGGNYAGYYGGGVSGDLINCTVVGNSAGTGPGGAWAVGRIVNSIVYYNSAKFNPNYLGHLTNCCTFPLPGSGEGNFTNPPVFRDMARSDFHLQTDSPCINAGRNTFLRLSPTSATLSITNDIEGNPRIAGETVDLGAYEFEGPGSVLSHIWAQHYGLPTDGSADFADPDNDGMSNWQESKLDTDPFDAQSVFRILALSNNVSSSTITWLSTSSRNYFVERAAGLREPLAFSIVGYVPGQIGTTSYTDLASSNSGSFFYRVQVEP